MTADDYAVDGRPNDGAIQAHARLSDHGSRGSDVGLGAFHVGRSLQHGRTCEIELGPRQLLVAGQRLRVLQLHAGVVQGRHTTGTFGLRSSESGFGFGKTRLKQGGIESRDHLTGLDARGEVDRQRRDRAGHLRAHLHHPRGLERSTDQDSPRNGTARDICGLHVKMIFIASDHDNRHDRPDGNRCHDPPESPAIRPVHNSQDTTVLLVTDEVERVLLSRSGLADNTA